MCVFIRISFIFEGMPLLTLKSFGRSFLRIERRAKATLDPMAILSREQKRRIMIWIGEDGGKGVKGQQKKSYYIQE